MCCSRLSELSNVLAEEKIILLDAYFHSLTPNSAKYITPTKIMRVLSIDYETSVKALLKLENIGVLNRYFGIRCPECSMLIKTMETLEELKFVNINTCYSCEKEIEISKDDIVILFKLNADDFPFDTGQQEASYRAERESPLVALPEDSFAMFKSMQDSLSMMALNAEHDYSCRQSKQESDKMDKKYEKRALNKYSRNVMVSVIFSILGYIVLVCIILYVYKQYGFNKVSIFSTFGSSLIPFGINYVVIKFFPQDIELIKRKLKAQDFEVDE
jgi:uncharacterized C2H2 Zn-finger protein